MFCKVKGTLNLMLDEISISIRVMSSFGRPSTISNGFEVGRTFEKGRVVTSLTDRQGECRPIFVDQQIIVHTTRKSVASPPPPRTEKRGQFTRSLHVLFIRVQRRHRVLFHTSEEVY